MLPSPSRPSYRSMEDKCTTLAYLNPGVQNWFVKVLVSEKTPVRLLKWGRQQRLVFVDKESTSMQSIIYEQDVDQLDKLLELYKTYYIGNAKIKEISGSTPALASSKHQMILSRSTYIRLTDQQEQIPINNIYHLTPFAKCHEVADVKNKQINLLCVVVHVFPPRFVERTRKNLQDFVVVNEERTPLILILWEEFLQSEAPYLTQNVHNMPVILGMRLSVNTFYGLSIGTVPNSTILFDPPIQRAEGLKLWIKANEDYIDTLVSQKLYEKSYRSIDQPSNLQIRKISQILSLTETVKSYWIKARLRIVNPQQNLYFLACPNCHKTCGADYGYEFTCFYCSNDFPSPKPLLRFEAELFDGTGSLNAYVENNEAQLLLGMSAEELIEEKQPESLSYPFDINKKFENSQFVFQVRTSTTETRGKRFVRNTIIACYPSSESSSASDSPKEVSSHFQTRRDFPADIRMAESQESTSKSQEKGLTIDPTEYPISTAGKRSLHLDEDLPHTDFKHSKQE